MFHSTKTGRGAGRGWRSPTAGGARCTVLTRVASDGDGRAEDSEVQAPRSPVDDSVSVAVELEADRALDMPAVRGDSLLRIHAVSAARFLTPRQGSLKVLRYARNWAHEGRIRVGRNSTHDILLDSIEDAYRNAGGRDHSAVNLAMGYVCLILPRNTDPGSRRLRIKKIVNWNGCQYVTQDAVIRVLQAAVEYAATDIRERKQEMRKAV